MWVEHRLGHPSRHIRHERAIYGGRGNFVDPDQPFPVLYVPFFMAANKVLALLFNAGDSRKEFSEAYTASQQLSPALASGSVGRLMHHCLTAAHACFAWKAFEVAQMLFFGSKSAETSIATQFDRLHIGPQANDTLAIFWAASRELQTSALYFSTKARASIEMQLYLPPATVDKYCK
jgi:hypothetical protein